MKRLIFFLILLCFVLHVSAQEPDSLYDINRLSNLTVMLYQPLTNELGTGTIIKYNEKYYLLTANHVAAQMHTGAKIVFRTGNDIPIFIDLVMFNKGHQLKWISHPTADISIVELVPFNDDTKSRLNSTCFFAELIDNEQLAPPSAFTFVYLGFPVIDLNLKHFSPLYFSSNIASGLITQSRKDNGMKCDFFYLDKPGLQGCSGSGVYISVKTQGMYYGGKKTILVGIIHGTEGDDTGGKLAMVTPSYYIWELLQRF
jgi:hypothetical protein